MEDVIQDEDAASDDYPPKRPLSEYSNDELWAELKLRFQRVIIIYEAFGYDDESDYEFWFKCSPTYALGLLHQAINDITQARMLSRFMNEFYTKKEVDDDDD